MSDALAEVLNAALLDEYMERDIYQKIIDKFGPVRPFVNIVQAEQEHINLLLPLFRKYDIPIPLPPNSDEIQVETSLLKACEACIAAEIENSTMYDRLIAVTNLPDVVSVLQHLQAASRDHHLPAFQQYIERVHAEGDGQSPKVGDVIEAG